MNTPNRSARRQGMAALQTVLLLGAAFVVVWGLMALWKVAKPPLQAHVHRILGVEARATSPGGDVSSGGRVGGGGRGVGGGDVAGGGGNRNGGANLPNSVRKPVVEPKETLFETPYGLLTDEQIGAKQKSKDWWWGLEGIILPGGNGAGAIIGSGSEWFGEIRGRSEAFALREGETAGETNALQHAYWQAQLAFWYGSEQAKSIGDEHETLQKYGNANRRRDSQADLVNNQVGRDIGEQVRKEADGPAGAKPGFDANQRMMQLIVDAIQTGRLDLDGGQGGVAGVGPGPGRGGLRNRDIKTKPYPGPR